MTSYEQLNRTNRGICVYLIFTGRGRRRSSPPPHFQKSINFDCQCRRSNARALNANSSLIHIERQPGGAGLHRETRRRRLLRTIRRPARGPCPGLTLMKTCKEVNAERFACQYRNGGPPALSLYMGFDRV